MNHRDFMRKAIALAVENVENGGGPFGAVIVKNGEVVATGVNRVTPNNDPTAHAEVCAIRAACTKLDTFDLSGCVIYSSCEPCPMCLAAIYWAHIDKIYYGANQFDAANIDFDDSFIYDQLSLAPELRSIPSHRMLGDEAIATFDKWREKEDKIEYFDPELSYELTGYRPITMTDGLDFDPAPFSEIAERFDSTKKYTEFPRGCKPYKDFWDEQKRRCVEGYTVGKYRVTGDHYFFLNFYRMQSPKISGTDKKTVGRGQSFPRFLSKQYEFFHYFEMCEILGRDVIMLKARGLGFSEMLACLAVRPFITTREFRTVITAAADAQLDPLLDKC